MIYIHLRKFSIFIYNVIIIYGRSGIIKLHSVGCLIYVRPKTRIWGSPGRATLQSGVLITLGYPVLMSLGSGVLMTLGYPVLMILKHGVLMIQESGVLMTLGYSVLLPLESGVLPFHNVMSLYEQL